MQLVYRKANTQLTGFCNKQVWFPQLQVAIWGLEFGFKDLERLGNFSLGDVVMVGVEIK